MDAAAVRQGAVLALLPAEAAVQRRAEAAAVELPRRAVEISGYDAPYGKQRADRIWVF